MAFCKVCGSQTLDGVEVCSLKCRRIVTMQKKRSYERRKKRQRTDVRRSLTCDVCGARLRHPGKRCVLHRRVGKDAGTITEAPGQWD